MVSALLLLARIYFWRFLSITLKLALTITVRNYESHPTRLMLFLTAQFNCVITIEADLACTKSDRFNCSTKTIKVIHYEKKITQRVTLNSLLL